VNNLLAGSKKAFAQKLEMARAVKAHGYPMVLNFVTHRHNIDKIDRIIELCIALEADLSNSPRASSTAGRSSTASGCCRRASNCSAPSASPTNTANARGRGHPCKLIFVTPDYYEERPSLHERLGQPVSRHHPGRHGLALSQRPAVAGAVSQRARPQHEHIWYDSFGFNRFRGYDWMKEPCRSCDESKRTSAAVAVRPSCSPATPQCRPGVQ
jgi:pyrroloquinoline quinone biosynthesis protein E